MIIYKNDPKYKVYNSNGYNVSEICYQQLYSSPASLINRGVRGGKRGLCNRPFIGWYTVTQSHLSQGADTELCLRVWKRIAFTG